MEALQTTAIQTVTTIAIALLSLLAAYATYGIRKITQKVKLQTEQLQDDKARNVLYSALSDVETLTALTVGAIEQTTAKQLREAVKDGKADRDELVALSKQALYEITGVIKPETQKIIEENFGNFRNYVSKLIEDQVRRVKTEPQ